MAKLEDLNEPTNYSLMIGNFPQKWSQVTLLNMISKYARPTFFRMSANRDMVVASFRSYSDGEFVLTSINGSRAHKMTAEWADRKSIEMFFRSPGPSRGFEQRRPDIVPPPSERKPAQAAKPRDTMLIVSRHSVENTTNSDIDTYVSQNGGIQGLLGRVIVKGSTHFQDIWSTPTFDLSKQDLYKRNAVFETD